jgi:prepilin-type processing-associated H-X9-DG protein
MRYRRGLTRTEVLITILAVILLVGCFLGAIFRIRTEADTMNCRNNQKQLVLAVFNYESTNNYLPMLIDYGKGSTTGEFLASGFALLAVYIEVSPFQWYPSRESTKEGYHAHSSIPFPWKQKDGSPGGEWEGGLVNQVWRVFIDPSDATAKELRDVPMTLPDGTTGYYATGSYTVNGLLPWGVRKRGEFPGGLSNTILFGERPQVCVNADGETIYNLWGVGFYSPHMPTFATLTPKEPPGMWSTNQIAPALPLPDEEGPVPIRIGRIDAPVDDLGVASPIQRIRTGRPCDPRLPGTPHSRGMQVAMCDGSVRVYSFNTSAWIFWKACVP